MRPVFAVAVVVWVLIAYICIPMFLPLVVERLKLATSPLILTDESTIVHQFRIHTTAARNLAWKLSMSIL